MNERSAAALVLASIAAVAAGCGMASAPPPSRAGACPEIPGLAAHLRPGAVLFFGEMHGSVETPALVADVACAVRAAGLPLVVGLEIPFEEGPRIEAYLASAGGAADRAALLAGPFWTDRYQDGRRSVAMASLLDGLRQLRAEGAVRVALFDSIVMPGGQQRDHEMAARLAAAVAAAPANAVAVVLTGNVHSRTRVGVPWNPAYEPMGYLSLPQMPGRHAVAFDLASPPGSVWMCETADAASCGPHDVGGRGDGGRRLELLPAPEQGHDGRYQLPSLTASPPAVPPATR